MARRSTWIVTGVLGAAGIAAGMSMALADEPTTIDLDAVDAPSTAVAPSSPVPGPTPTTDPRAVDPASPAPGSSVTAQSADTPAPTPEPAPAQTQAPAQAPAQTSAPASGTSGRADAPVVVSPASPVSADTPDDDGSDDADDADDD